MSHIAHVKYLMREIGPLLNLAEVTEFEDESLWILAFEDDTVVEISYDDDQKQVFLSVEFGKPSPGNELAIYKTLLTYNYAWESTGGARMALAGDSGNAVLIFDQTVTELELPRLQTLLENLHENALLWREFVEKEPEVTSANNSDEDIPFQGLRV